MTSQEHATEIYLPTGTGSPAVAAGSDATSEGDATAEDDRRTSAEGRPRRVVIIEDDWFIATENEALLLQAGYEVTGIVMDKSSALDLVDRCRPDLALVDIELARGDDGVAVACILRERFGVPCLFVTAYGDARTRSRGEEARPRGWLIKPFTGDQLLGMVERALSEED